MTTRRFATVLALADHTAGNRRQALALAQALRADAQFVEVNFPALSRWLAPHWPTRAMDSLPASLHALPGPILVIGCGRQAALAVRALKHARRDEVFTLQILDPRCKLTDFDLLVVPEHDDLAGPKILKLLGALHPIDERWLARARADFHELALKPKPWVSVLIGGPNHAQRIDVRWIDRLFDWLASQRQEIGTLAVSASRRTPANLREHLRLRANQLGASIWLDERDGRNPYPAMLALADRIVVSPDSVNMISEACAVGVPVHTLTTAPLRGKLRRFHAALRDRGLLHDLGAHAWPRPPLRELPAIVDEVKARLTYTLS